METLAWLLTALQSSDEAVASHALLLLWKRVQQDAPHGLTSQAFVTMPAKPWRRLGLLLFAEDALTVKAVVSVITALVTSGHEGGASEGKRAVRLRVWQSDWRQFIIDKVTDCHSRATTSMLNASQSKATNCHDLEVATRLLVVIRTVFMHALQEQVANTKDQARVVDLLVELAASPLDTIPCVSLAWLASILHRSTPTEPALDPEVLAYLEASKVFVQSLQWLSEQIPGDLVHTQQSARSRNVSNAHKRLLTRRCQLTLSLLVRGTRQSREIAVAVVRRPDILLGVCLGIVEATRHPAVDTESLHELSVELLTSVLGHHCPQTTEVVSQLRLDGGLITLSWLQSHRSSEVREATGSIFSHILRVSPRSDLLRALVEQGCVVVSYLQRRDDSATHSPILRWVVDVLEDSGPQLAQTIAQSAVRSTNHKLQRNVILSLLLLSQSSDDIHEELFSVEDRESGSLLNGVARAAIHANDDASLATSLLAMAAIFADKRSTLRLDNTSKVILKSASSQRDLTSRGSTASRRIVELVCADSEIITADGTMLEQHCMVIKQQFDSLVSASLSGSPSDSVVIDLREFNATTVHLFVQLLAMTAQQTATRLQPYKQDQVKSLFTLSQRLECAKCWHAATHATTHALQHGVIHWKPVLDLALCHRHPALMLRAIRVALSESAKLHPADFRPHETHEAALAVWHELLRVEQRKLSST